LGIAIVQDFDNILFYQIILIVKRVFYSETETAEKDYFLRQRTNSKCTYFITTFVFMRTSL